ncbi:hypothetical protein NDA13_005791 [Ustilago tritici]|nr:hypothetical protein NDA13_005791 [Ustilago tritici]
MTTTTDDSLDISAQLFWQSATPTSSTTQTRNIPVLSQYGSTSTPDIYTSCPNRVSGSATGKKNFTWSSLNVLCLITIIYNSKSYQHALLPSRELTESNPGNKLHKHPIFWEIFKLIFPGTSVEPNHIKAKLRWVQETYYKEKKKLSITGAGMLLEDREASNLSYTSCLALSTKYAWFEKMHKMMNGQSSAKPTTLITTPSLNFTSNDKAGMPPTAQLKYPWIFLAVSSVASTSGASVAGAGDDDIFTTPFPSQARLSFSAAGGLDVFESSSSPSSALLSSGTKHK